LWHLQRLNRAKPDADAAFGTCLGYLEAFAVQGERVHRAEADTAAAVQTALPVNPYHVAPSTGLIWHPIFKDRDFVHVALLLVRETVETALQPSLDALSPPIPSAVGFREQLSAPSHPRP
jgi:hypothetical protein